MNTGKLLSLAAFKFGDLGIETIVTETIPFLKDQDELVIIGNFYALVMGSEGIEKKSPLVGPLPVVHYHDQLLMIFGSSITDETIKDERVIRSGHKTRCFVFIFFPASYDGIISRFRPAVRDLLVSWFRNKEKVSDITSENLTDLRKEQEKMVKIALQNQNHTLNNPDFSFSSAFMKHFELLSMLSSFTKRSTKIGVFGNIESITGVIQGILSRNNFFSVEGMMRIPEKNHWVFKFSKLYVEISQMESGDSTGFLNAGRDNYSRIWREYPKDYDGVLAMYNISGFETDTSENLNLILSSLPVESPLSLLISYSPSFEGNIKSIGIPEVLSHFAGKTVTLIETTTEEKEVGDTQLALIELVEKIITVLSNKN
ncbi:MAG: hypothetical protein ACFFD4_14000 [Candidatus Odinarchaeota archaeon]